MGEEGGEKGVGRRRRGEEGGEKGQGEGIILRRVDARVESLRIHICVGAVWVLGFECVWVGMESRS